jgi:hypothetical protein
MIMNTENQPEDEELTDDMINELCSYLRVIDLMQKNPEMVNSNAELKKEYEAVCKTTNDIMEALTEEQRDKVLETHRLQLIFLSGQQAAKQTKKKGKK